MSKMLIIDDDPEIQSLLKDALRKGGHERRVAETDKAALKCVKESTQDLILLDLSDACPWRILVSG